MSRSLHTSLPPLPNSNRWTSAVSGQIGFVQTRSKTLERFVPVLFTFAVHPNLLPDAWHTPYLPKWPSECFLPTPTSNLHPVGDFLGRHGRRRSQARSCPLEDRDAHHGWFPALFSAAYSHYVTSNRNPPRLAPEPNHPRN
jgi:hypothetical protein